MTPLHRIDTTGSIKLSLTDDGELSFTSDKPLSEVQDKWLKEHHDYLHRELITANIHQMAYPEGFGALLMQYTNIWDFMDALADKAYSSGGQWQQALNGLVWWLSLCIDYEKITINQLRIELGVMPRFFLKEYVADERAWFAELIADMSHGQIKTVVTLYNNVFDSTLKANEHLPVKRENLARCAANIAITEHMQVGKSQCEKSMAEMIAMLQK